MEKSSENNDQEQHQGDVVDLSASVVITQSVPTGSIDDPNKVNKPTGLSLVQSLLEQTEEADPKKKKKKKKAKTGRQKEIERLTKATKNIFASAEKLNAVCERIHLILLPRKLVLLGVCRSLDKMNSGFLTSEQFRLVIKDRLPGISREDLFVLMKLFETEGSVNYRAILDETVGPGIIQHITQLPVPPSKEIVLEKKPTKEQRQPFNEPIRFNHPKFVTLYLRLITFDSYNAYPGHIHLTVPDHLSVYALSKMIIEKTDLPTLNVDIFREKLRSRQALLDPMRTLEDQRYIGAYTDGSHKQMFSDSSSRQLSAGSALQSMNSRLSSNMVDYSPWMRQKRQTTKSDEQKKSETMTVGLPPLREERKCSARCRHMRKEKTPDLVAPENPEKIQWLTMQLNIYRTRIQEFTQLENDLLTKNRELRETISSMERVSHETVASNIRRFDQYKKTMSLVEQKQNEEKEALLEKLEHERQALANEVEMYENQVSNLENQLSDSQQFLKQLKTYKDSEYPEKEQMIQKLLHEIEETKLFDSEEIDEMNRILKKQKEQQEENLRQVISRLKNDEASSAFSMMHESYFLVALDNDQMKKEISVQEEKLRLLQVEYENLKKINQQLKNEQKKTLDTRHLFPHIFRHELMPICTPDMDVVLDLPKRPTPLPI